VCVRSARTDLCGGCWANQHPYRDYELLSPQAAAGLWRSVWPRATKFLIPSGYVVVENFNKFGDDPIALERFEQPSIDKDGRFGLFRCTGK
jgi:hypothetical protein